MVGTQVVRIALLLAIGCLATCHGSMEMETAPHELGESADMGVDPMEVTEDDASEYQIESDDQEDRIGVSSVDDFDQDDTPAAPKKTLSDADLAHELKAIQDDGDQNTLLGEEDSTEAKSPEVILASGDVKEKDTKSREVNGKASDKSIEKAKKQNELSNKEDDTRAEAKKKEEIETKETTTKHRARRTESSNKKQAEEKSEKTQDNELKAKDEKSTAAMEQQLARSREDSELDGKREHANEKKDKASEKAGKFSANAEGAQKTAASDKIRAEDRALKEKKAQMFELKTKKDKKTVEDASALKTADDLRQLEADKKIISEKGDKAYSNELSLESKHKADNEQKRQVSERAEKKKEMRQKNSVTNEQSEKTTEVKTKADLRATNLAVEQKKTAAANEQAHKGTEFERVAKVRTIDAQKVLANMRMEMLSTESVAEVAQKEYKRAYTKEQRDKADKDEKLSKSKLSEIQSKVEGEVDKVDKARKHRELAGKVGRERANKYAEVQGEHLAALVAAKQEAEKELDGAEKAQAELDYVHAKSEEKDTKEAAIKVDDKEASLKSTVNRADKKLIGRHAKMDKVDAIERKDELGQKKSLEKTSKFSHEHVEAREKDLQLAKQRVEGWLNYDTAVKAKLISLESWQIKTAEDSSEAIKVQVEAEKAVEGHTASAERAVKKGDEVLEKEKMNISFKELLRKDDEKEKQEAMKRLAEEKELIQKDTDRSDRAEEKTEKQVEISNKAQSKEKESLDKMQEGKLKAGNVALSSEKTGKKEVKTKGSLERNQKQEMDLAAKAATAKVKKSAAAATVDRDGLSEAARAMATSALDVAESDYKEVQAQEKQFKAQIDEEQTTAKEEEQKEVELNKNKIATATKYEKKIKEELADKTDVKDKQEAKGKAKLKEMGEKSKLRDQQAMAAAEARKAVRIAEKSAKDIQSGRDKDEREKKQYALQTEMVRERNGKKGDSQIAAKKAENAANGKKMAAGHAMLTLGIARKKQTSWSEKLQALQEHEKSSREKELKALPVSIVQAEQIKYRRESAEQQKISDDAEKSFEGAKASWQIKESKAKKFTGKEKMLKEEKRSLLKQLGDAVREEYSTGKKLKKSRDKLDKDALAAQSNSGKLQALKRFEIGQQQLEEDAKDKVEAIEKQSKSDEKAAAKKAAALGEAETGAQTSAQEEGMAADVASTGKAKEKANAAAAADQAKATSLEGEKSAAEDEAAQKASASSKQKAISEEIKEKADAKRRESQSKIVMITSSLTVEKKDKTTVQARMKLDEKTTTKKVRTLRNKEMQTKHAEIEERSQMEAASAQEEEMAKRKADTDIDYNKNREMLSKAEERVKEAAAVISAHKNSDGANSAKEVGLKTGIQNSHKMFIEETAADTKIRQDLDRTTREKREADDRKATAQVHFKKASETERNSKHDALERNKKSEASAIQDAIERKNKAAEKAVKAFEAQAELKNKQFLRAKKHDHDVKGLVRRLTDSKELLGSKYGMTDEWQVTKMESASAESVEFAESKQKSAQRVLLTNTNAATTASEWASHARAAFDKAKAILKKSNDVVEASAAGKEASHKSAGMAVKETDKKHAMKENRAADMAARIAVMKEKKVKFTISDLQAKFTAGSKGEALAQKHADDASQQKLKANQAFADAKQHQESSAKLSDRFRTLSAQITENSNKRKASTSDMMSQEKASKYATEEVKKAKNSCTKGAEATVGVGKAFNKLQTEMKAWSMKHKWLKHKPKAERNVGEGRGQQHASIVTATSNELVEEEMRDDVSPDYASMSVVELIQLETGPDVTEWIFT